MPSQRKATPHVYELDLSNSAPEACCGCFSVGRSAVDGGHQARVATGCGRVDASHALSREARDIMRSAGLGTSAAEPLPAERLAFDDRTDLIAVDVEIADPGMLL